VRLLALLATVRTCSSWGSACDRSRPHRTSCVRHSLSRGVPPVASGCTWSSLWPRPAGLLIRFDLRRSGDETDLVWALLSPTPVEDPSGVGHMRKRLNEIINRDLRYGFGQ
jgi:hypothetical protein